MQSAWEEFAAEAVKVNLQQLGFSPDVVLGVDWHGVGAGRALVGNRHNEATIGAVPIVYMSYRVSVPCGVLCAICSLQHTIVVWDGFIACPRQHCTLRKLC